MPRRRERSQLGEVIHRTRVDAQLEQAELAEKVGTSQPRISDLEGSPDHLEKLLDIIRAIEDVCGHRRGHVLRKAGYVDDQADVLTLIATDPTLDQGRREVLLQVYSLMRRDSAAEAAQTEDTKPAGASSASERERRLAGHALESARPKRARDTATETAAADEAS